MCEGLRSQNPHTHPAAGDEVEGSEATLMESHSCQGEDSTTMLTSEMEELLYTL